MMRICAGDAGIERDDTVRGFYLDVGLSRTVQCPGAVRHCASGEDVEVGEVRLLKVRDQRPYILTNVGIFKRPDGEFVSVWSCDLSPKGSVQGFHKDVVLELPRACEVELMSAELLTGEEPDAGLDGARPTP